MAKELILGVSFEHMGNLDVFLFKTGIFAFALFLVPVWPGFARWAMATHWGWFLAIFVICWMAIMPKLWK